MSRGLYGQKYSGYFANDLNFFNTAAYIGSESTFTSISLGDEGTSYSWKWYGFIIASSTGTYTFQTTSDDASYVYIDGTRVVDNGDTHGARTISGTIDLILGKRYRIQIYFGENAGAASMIFSWSGGSQTSLTTDLTTDVLQFYPQADIARRGKNLFQPRDVAFYRIPSEYQNVNQMTDDTTNIPGFGNVVASVSSRQESYRNAAKAFNGEIVSNDGWRSAVEYSNGTYTGSASLGGYAGEWIKIQFPKPLFLYNSRIHARPTFIERLTKTGHIIASNDDINWVKIADIIRNDGVDSFYTNTSYLTTPYCFYAIVSTSIESTETTVNIGEWFLYTRKIEYNPIDINDGLKVHLDATVGVSYPGSGDTWYDISGNGNHFIINASAYQTTYMDFQGSYGIAKRVVNGALSDIGPYPEATIVCVCELLETTSTWRTLIRGASSDHQVIVRQSDSLMGLYANGRGNFYSSGFNIQNLPSGYNVLVWKLSQSSPYYQFTYNDTGVYYNITNENTSFINGFCCIGGFHNGNIDVNTASQYFGKIKNFMFYDRFLNTAEIHSLYNRFRV
jgi:hypothetical protein